MENCVKSDGLTARLSVTAKPKNSRCTNPTSTDVRGSTSCCTDAVQFQSDGRTPQPCRMSGSMVLLNVAVPKFRLLMMPQKSPDGPKSCGCGFARSQSGIQLPLRSVHVLVTLVAMREVGLPRP